MSVSGSDGDEGGVDAFNRVLLAFDDTTVPPTSGTKGVLVDLLLTSFLLWVVIVEGLNAMTQSTLLSHEISTRISGSILLADIDVVIASSLLASHLVRTISSGCLPARTDEGSQPIRY